MNVVKVVKNLQKYMLLYAVLAIVGGTFWGSYVQLRWISKLILPIVFIMIYPMMVKVSFESLKNIKESLKPLTIGVVVNFLLAPLLMILISSFFRIPHLLFIALILLSVAPASSMGLGYVGLSKGNMVTATVIVAAAFLLSVVVYPITITLLGRSSYIEIPTLRIIQSLIYVLILPLILGITTREYLIERKGVKFKSVAPYFSLITLAFLYILLFLIFSLKGPALLKRINSLKNLIIIAIIFYPVLLSIVVIIDKYLVKIDYSNHQSVVFTTVSKNVSLTIGILSVSFGEKGKFMAMTPAIFSLIQTVFLVTYLHLSPRIQKLWERAEEKLKD